MSPKNLRPCSFSAPAKTKLYQITRPHNRDAHFTNLPRANPLRLSHRTPRSPPQIPPAPQSPCPPAPAFLLCSCIPSRAATSITEMTSTPRRLLRSSPALKSSSHPGHLFKPKLTSSNAKAAAPNFIFNPCRSPTPTATSRSVTGPITLESDDGYALKDPGKDRNLAGIALPAAGGRRRHRRVDWPLRRQFAAQHHHQHSAARLYWTTAGLPFVERYRPRQHRAKTRSSAPRSAEPLERSLSSRCSSTLTTFFLDVGSPVEMVLQHPLSLQQDQVATAIRDAAQHPAPQQPISPRPQPCRLRPTIPTPASAGLPAHPALPASISPAPPPSATRPALQRTHIPGIPPLRRPLIPARDGVDQVCV